MPRHLGGILLLASLLGGCVQRTLRPLDRSPLLAAQFASSQGQARCLEVKTVDASHSAGWEAAWAEFRQAHLACAPQNP